MFSHPSTRSTTARVTSVEAVRGRVLIALPARRALAHEACYKPVRASRMAAAGRRGVVEGCSMAGMGEDRTGRDRPTTGRRVSVSEAAGVLGISVEAVRGRIKRGTIGHERDGDRVYVLLDADQAATGLDQGDDQTADRPAGPLVELLRAQVEDLRAERDAWRDQARRSDYMASAHFERTRELEGRLRELEAPAGEATEARESPESPSPTRTPTEATGEADAGAQEPERAPWWRRIFGG